MQAILKQAKAFAASSGFFNEAEDFAQEAAFKISRGRKASFDKLFTDFLRIEYGDSRYDNEAEFEAKRFPQQLEHHSESFSLPSSAIENIQWAEIIDGLDPIGRAVIVLYFKFNLTTNEIGEVFNKRPSWVCRVLEQTKKKLAKSESIKGNA